MRIYRERMPAIAHAIADALVDGEMIEVEPAMREEVELDLESVLKEYRRTDRELSDRARDLVAMRNLDYSYTHKLKGQLAREKAFGLGDEAIEWIAGQMIEMLLQSANVEEVFGEDHDLRRLIAPILRRELGMESKLDHEVRKRIKNMSEGTSEFDIEYQKTMERLREAKKLSD